MIPVGREFVFEVGPVIDDTDFKTLETAVAFNAAGITVALHKQGVGGGDWTSTALTLAASGNNRWTHIGGGYYNVHVTAAQNDTIGKAHIRGIATGVLPFESSTETVVPAEAFDNALSNAADEVIVKTTIATLTSQTVFTLTDGPTDNNAINGALVIFRDAATAAQKAYGFVNAYVGASKQVTLEAAPSFTIATTDYVTIVAPTQAMRLGADARAQVNTEADTAILDAALVAKLDAIDDFVDTEMAATLAAVDTEVASILNALTAARSEPAAGAPPVNPALVVKVDYLYAVLRNKKTVNEQTGMLQFYADDGTTVLFEVPYTDAANVLTVSEAQANT